MEHCEVHIFNELRLNMHGLHLIVHPVGSDHLISHAHAERLHRVALVVLVVSDIVVIEIADHWLPQPAQGICHL